LPSEDRSSQRQAISQAFRAYTDLLAPLCERYGAVGHWAKIEVAGPQEGEGEGGSERVGEEAKVGAPAQAQTQTQAQTQGQSKVTYVNALTGAVSSHSHTAAAAAAAAAAVAAPVAQSPPHPNPRTQWQRLRLQARYDVDQYNAYRRVLDPRGILANHFVEALLPLGRGGNPGPAWKAKAK
jgi:hypothetical protein